MFNKSLDFRDQSGAGAAGGIGYGLSLAYNVEFIPGFSLVKNWFDLEEKIKQADIILTGEGRFDKTSLYGKGPYEIIKMASEYEKKVILLAGSVDFEVVSRLHSDFSNLKAVSFSKESLELVIQRKFYPSSSVLGDDYFIITISRNTNASCILFCFKCTGELTINCCHAMDFKSFYNGSNIFC